LRTDISFAHPVLDGIITPPPFMLSFIGSTIKSGWFLSHTPGFRRHIFVHVLSHRHMFLVIFVFNDSRSERWLFALNFFILV